MTQASLCTISPMLKHIIEQDMMAITLLTLRSTAMEASVDFVSEDTLNLLADGIAYCSSVHTDSNSADVFDLCATS